MENGLRIRTKAPPTQAKQTGVQGNVVNNGGHDHSQEETTTEMEEPLSPFGRLYHMKSLNVCIVVIIGFAVHLDVDVLKRYEKFLTKNPRFTSKLVLDAENGKKQRWVRTKVIPDDHLIVPDLDPDMENPDRFVEDYASELSSKPFDLSKPLWEFHILNVKTSNAEAVGLFKIHHSLGDGMSLLALILSCSRKTFNPAELPSIPRPVKKVSQNAHGSAFRYLTTIWLILQLIWNTLIGFTQVLATCFFLKDTDSPLKREKVDESSSKRIVYRVVSLDDIKLVKNEMNTTVNDVIVGLTDAALSRYLHNAYEQDSISAKRDCRRKKLRLRANIAVNVRDAIGTQEKGSRYVRGNAAGIMLIPFKATLEHDPLEYVRRVKLVIDRKKLSLEAKLTYYVVLAGVKLLGVKIALALLFGVARNTTLMFSSVFGPVDEIEFCEHRVAHITPTARNAGGYPPGIIIHFMSYMNKMSIAMSANQDLIPEPHRLLDELEESLKLMKGAVVQKKQENKGLH